METRTLTRLFDKATLDEIEKNIISLEAEFSNRAKHMSENDRLNGEAHIRILKANFYMIRNAKGFDWNAKGFDD